MSRGRRSGRPHSSAALLMSGVAVSTSVNGLNSTMMAAVLLTVGSVLGLGEDVVWLVTSFYVASAVGLPVFGRLADGWGSRNVLSLGLGLVLLGALGSLVHDSLWWLVCMRVLIGLGSSTAYPASTSVLKGRATASEASTLSGLTVMALSAQSTVMVAPALGALLVATLGWQALFLVNVPLALYALVVVRSAFPRAPTSPATQVRPAATIRSAVLFCAGVTAVLLALSVFPSPTWTLWLLCGAAAAWVAYWFSERRSPTPFVDVGMLRGQPLALAAIVRQGGIMFMLYATMYGIPVWMERARSLDPTLIGAIMIPLAGAGVISTVLAPRLLTRWSASSLISVGLLVLLGVCAVIIAVGPRASVPTLVLLMTLLGLPNGLFMLGNQLAFLEAVPSRVVGVASGLLRTSQYIAASVAMVAVAQTASRMGHPDHALVALLAVVMATCLLLIVELHVTRHRFGVGAEAA